MFLGRDRLFVPGLPRLPVQATSPARNGLTQGRRRRDRAREEVPRQVDALAKDTALHRYSARHAAAPRCDPRLARIG